MSLARGGAAAAAAAGMSGALSFLPNLLQDMVEPSRHTAHINLKDNAIPSVVAFSADENVLVVTTAGYFYVYSLPPFSATGACRLESEHSLLDPPSEAMGAKIHNFTRSSSSSSSSSSPSPPVQDVGNGQHRSTAGSVGQVNMEYDEQQFGGAAQRRR